jgi:hypothetical protein
MNKNEQRYFEWLCDKIIDDESNLKYSKLMSHLYDTIFVPVMEMDENRAEDGKGLRRRFELETQLPKYTIADIFQHRTACSMLEMMVALAIRCEETIMTDEEYGDRTAMWFWNMIVSLGLGTMNDNRFDEKYINIVLDRFMDRQYKRNGEGGLFTIDGIKKDMRTIEIWYQMMWYLDNL